jgi:hypothetical protein
LEERHPSIFKAEGYAKRNRTDMGTVRDRKFVTSRRKVATVRENYLPVIFLSSQT